MVINNVLLLIFACPFPTFFRGKNGENDDQWMPEFQTKTFFTDFFQ
jgi:hypothetical protein